MGKVVVTGATGFIGSHIIIQLLNQGHEVVGTIRNLERGDALRSILSEYTNHLDKLSFARIDLMSDEGWDEAFTGADYVMHVASPVPVETPKDENDIIEPARQGALRAMKAAARAGVKRVVLTSSVAAIMYGHAQEKVIFTENDWTNPADKKDNSAYTKSKTLAERAAWDFVKQDQTGLELVTINPGMVLGPVLESDYGASATVVKKLFEGAFPGTPKIGWPITDVRDVAEMHVLAMTTPAAAGERFIAANGFLWMNDIAHVLKKEMPEKSKKVPTKNLPTWLMRILANFDKEVKSVAFELARYRDTPSDKAQKILGWKPRSNEEAIVSCAQSLIRHGVVSP